MAVFWSVAPCSLVEVLAASIIRAMANDGCSKTSETFFYQTTRRYNPEDGHLPTHRHENWKSYYLKMSMNFMMYILGCVRYSDVVVVGIPVLERDVKT
jgi:hypothetical protein